MSKVRNLAALLALSGVALLPACSLFGGPDRNPSATRTTSAPAPTYSSPAPAAPELTPDMTRAVQQNLQQAGMYHGRIDGIWGRRTEAAVRNFQQQHNLTVTGKLDQDTLSAMNLGSNVTPQQRYGSSDNPPPPDTMQPTNNPPPDNSAPNAPPPR